MRFVLAFIALLLTAFSLPVSAQAGAQMIQCEACSTTTQMKSVAMQRGDGQYYVFSLKNSVVMRFQIQYDHETSSYRVWSPPPGPTMEEAFALMLDANELKPGIFAGQQTLSGSITKLGGGPHDPVKISLNGEHDSAYGSFIYYVGTCLSSQGCTSQINPALGKIVGAESLLNSIGFSILGTGGNMSWESLPPSFKLWLCNSNNDCALLQYKNGDWTYIESRAEGGAGKRYPKYGESLNYKFANSGEAGIFDRGLRNGGAQVRGTYQTHTYLACVSAGGSTTCEYVTVPN